MDFVCLFGIEDKEARKGTACSDLPDSPHSVFLEHNWPTTMEPINKPKLKDLLASINN
jgi:hypothetical protein